MYQSSKKSSCNKQTAEPPQSSTLIYIDSANIIFSARTACFELNMMHLLQHLKDSFRSSHIVYFTGKFNKQQDEYDAISDMGIEMVYKQIYNEGQKAKANCDVEIAHRVTLDLLSDPPREIVLLSGDGDFACLYDFAHAKGITVRVMAVDVVSCSRVVKRRNFIKLSFLDQLQNLITKEKPPAGT